MPRSDGFFADGVAIHNFAANMRPFETNSEGDHPWLWNQGGKEYHFRAISYFSVESTILIFWQNWRKEIIFDMDGSMTGTNLPTYMTPIYPHLKGLTGCDYTQALVDRWDQAVVCTGKKLKKVELLSPLPADQLRGVQLKILRLSNPTLTLATAVDTDYTQSFNVLILNKYGDNKNGFVAIFATGESYHLHFKEGIDWTHLLLSTSLSWQPYTAGNNEKPFILSFNYTNSRELYDVAYSVGGVVNALKYDPIAAPFDGLNCKYGSYIFNNVTKNIDVCISGNG